MMQKVNPFVKAVTVLICGLALSFSYSIRLNGCVISVCLILLCFSHVNLSAVLKVFFAATVPALSLFLAAGYGSGYSVLLPEAAASQSLNFSVVSAALHSMETGAALGLRIYAYTALGALFVLTTVPEAFVYSLIHQAKVPDKFAYGVLAALHLAPAVGREYRQIRLAYRVRGYRLHPFSLRPVFSMLVNTIHWSESVAMAMESKGFDSQGCRTYYCKPQVGTGDYVFLTVSVTAVIAGLFLL